MSQNRAAIERFRPRCHRDTFIAQAKERTAGSESHEPSRLMSIPLLARLRNQAPPNAGMTMPSHQPPNELVSDKTPEAPSQAHTPRQINPRCLPVRERRICSAIDFWVGGISRRRVVLEGWGYTPQAHAAHGVDAKHRNQQPPPWPDRYELSHAAVEEPTPEVLEELRERFGATWLVAVRRAGPGSERLDDLTELAFENADVPIYRIGQRFNRLLKVDLPNPG